MLTDRPAEVIARHFHETYEHLAPAYGYETRAESAVPWEDVPERNRALMVHVVGNLLAEGVVAAPVTHDHGTRTGWFADVSDEEDRVEGAPWQAFIQTAGGCFPLPIWFATKDDCEAFIRRDVLNRGMLDDI